MCTSEKWADIAPANETRGNWSVRRGHQNHKDGTNTNTRGEPLYYFATAGAR